MDERDEPELLGWRDSGRVRVRDPGEAPRPLVGDARRTGYAEDDGAAGRWVAAEAVAVGAVQGVVFVLGVQGLTEDAVKFAEGGDGWLGRRGRFGLDSGDHLVEGRRVGMLGDGVIEVIGEATHTAMEPGQDAEGIAAVGGFEEIGRAGIDLGEGYQVPGRQADVVNDAAEGIGEPAFGMGTEVPVHGGGSHGVAGGASDGDGGGSDFAKGQVDASAVEMALAGALVGLYGSDGGLLLWVGRLVSWLVDCGRQDFASLSAYGRVGYATI